jgi:serine/threonine protein kinase
MVSVAIKKAKHGETLAAFFDREARNLRALCEYNSPHLIKPIAAYHIAEDRCLVFPWADGGNLGDYWTGHESQRSASKSLLWIVQQFGGIFAALTELHENNCRHGDLKPENILWFQDDSGHGTLQIADLGLATFHAKEEDTKGRKGVITSTPSGTSRYEPPEMDSTREAPDARSRQYDMWSMGCVLLELLVWLVYGNKALDKFKSFTEHFWEPGDRAGNAPYKVHPYVASCIRVMKSQLQDKDNNKTAYKDLLSIVEKRLLVVAVSEAYVSSTDHREIAAVLCAQMAEIERICQSSETYLTPLDLNYPSDIIRAQQQHTPTGTSRLEVPGGRRVSIDTLARQEPSPEGNLPDRTVIRRPTGEGGLEIRSSSNMAAPEHQVSRYIACQRKAQSLICITGLVC